MHNFNINSQKQTKNQPLSGSFRHIHILWVSELLQATSVQSQATAFQAHVLPCQT